MKQILIAVFLIPISDTSALAQERIQFSARVASKVLGYGRLPTAWLFRA